jgi:hypothetical protein
MMIIRTGSFNRYGLSASSLSAVITAAIGHRRSVDGSGSHGACLSALLVCKMPNQEAEEQTRNLPKSTWLSDRPDADAVNDVSVP